MALIWQGKFDETDALLKPLQTLLSDFPEDFDSVNRLETYSASALVCLKRGDLDQAEAWIAKGIDEIADWGRPMGWRVIPCGYYFAEATLRLYFQRGRHGDKKYAKWVKAAIANMQHAVAVYPVAKPKQFLLKGWYALMCDKPAAAKKHWRKALKLAREFDIHKDIALLNMAFSHLNETDRVSVELMTPDELGQYTEDLHFTDTAYHGDWRI